MMALIDTETAAPEDSNLRSAGRSQRQWRPDLLPIGAYLGLALWIYSPLWAAPADRRLAWVVSDQLQHEWFLAWAAHALLHGVNPFVTDAVNAPAGINLLANTSMLGLGLPLAPVTWVFGSAVTYVLAMTLGLAGTATGWYLVLRRVVPSRAGAALGGGLCGFGPPMISHANVHLNFTAQFLVPWLVWAALRLGKPGRALRNGALLGLLVTWQFFIGEEVLTYTALATGLFLMVWVALRWSVARTSVGSFARGLGVAALVAGAFLVYPIWVQFRGPYAYHQLSPGAVWFYNDVAAFVSTPRPDAGSLTNYALNGSEQNAHFGWALMVLAPLLVVWLRRSAAVVAAAFVGVVFAALSLGREITVAGKATGIPGPWAVVGHLPLLGNIAPSRLSMVCLPVLGFLVATAAGRLSDTKRPIQALLPVALLVALLPLVPGRKAVVPRRPVPVFFTSGDWSRYIRPSDTVVPVPVPSPQDITAYRWQTRVDFDLRLVGGYFFYPSQSGLGILGTPTATSELLDAIANGHAPAITGQARRTAVADMQHWGADEVVLPLAQPNSAELALAVSSLLGVSGQRVDDVMLWNVRSLRTSPQ